MSLLLVLPYCQKDLDLVKKQTAWIAELKADYRPHSCLLVADAQVGKADMQAVQGTVKPLFQSTETMIVQVPPDRQSWPLGPNFMFAAAARQISECCKLPWLWFEPDATPLKATWLDELERDYEKSAKRFMGSLVYADDQPDMPPVHLAGCAIYDAAAFAGLQPFTAGKLGWDIAAAGFTVPRSAPNIKMQHYWGKQDLAPTFAFDPTKDQENLLGLEFIKSTSLTFHRCKDGSLIDALRQKILAARRPTKKLVPAKPVPAVETQ